MNPRIQKPFAFCWLENVGAHPQSARVVLCCTQQVWTQRPRFDFGKWLFAVVKDHDMSGASIVDCIKHMLWSTCHVPILMIMYHSSVSLFPQRIQICIGIPSRKPLLHRTNTHVWKLRVASIRLAVFLFDLLRHSEWRDWILLQLLYYLLTLLIVHTIRLASTVFMGIVSAKLEVSLIPINHIDIRILDRFKRKHVWVEKSCVGVLLFFIFAFVRFLWRWPLWLCLFSRVFSFTF